MRWRRCWSSSSLIANANPRRGPWSRLGAAYGAPVARICYRVTTFMACRQTTRKWKRCLANYAATNAGSVAKSARPLRDFGQYQVLFDAQNEEELRLQHKFPRRTTENTGGAWPRRRNRGNNSIACIETLPPPRAASQSGMPYAGPNWRRLTQHHHNILSRQSGS